LNDKIAELALQKDIEDARQDYKEGNTRSFSSSDDALAWLMDYDE
jgi:hypothetical protein